jgi:syntaxin 5
MAISLQDRTSEFHTLTTAVSKKLKARTNAHQRLLVDESSRPKNPRGEFARRAADIGRAITDTMGKLERLAMRTCAPPSWPTQARILNLTVRIHSGQT